MGHILIQTREGYRKRESVYPAPQGTSAELVGSRVCVLQGIFVFLGVQI